MKTNIDFETYKFNRKSDEQMLEEANAFLQKMKKRRSVRQFSTENIPLEVIKKCIQTASLAPSGINKQPWLFALVTDNALKQKIKIEVEKNEEEAYKAKYSDDFLEKMIDMKIDFHKDFLTEAPALIIVFKEKYRVVDGEIEKNNYVNESVGIATGFLITAIHNAGLVTLPYTCPNMSFLNKILERPESESPILFLPVGFPKKDVQIPVLKRKGLEEVMKIY